MNIAWIAHFYTGLGVVCALPATLAVFRRDYRAAFLWLGLQMAIDATDGLLARALKVQERLPDFDGARLDDIIDYLTYVFVPVLLLLHAGLAPAGMGRRRRRDRPAVECLRLQSNGRQAEDHGYFLRASPRTGT